MHFLSARKRGLRPFLFVIYVHNKEYLFYATPTKNYREKKRLFKLFAKRYNRQARMVKTLDGR